MISFTGKTSLGAFYTQILEGTKTQTCRKPRKYPVLKGDPLQLYWNVRVPKHKKPIHRIGTAYCTDVKRMRYREFAYDDEFARRDGFRDSSELQEWFGDPRDCGDEEYTVISFKLKR